MIGKAKLKLENKVEQINKIDMFYPTNDSTNVY